MVEDLPEYLIREAVKCYFLGKLSIRFSGFFPLWGGGGDPPIPLRKKSAKNSDFWPKTPILALFDPFFDENFRQFFVKGGGGTPPFR